jgi:hypothetical protein
LGRFDFGKDLAARRPLRRRRSREREEKNAKYKYKSKAFREKQLHNAQIPPPGRYERRFFTWLSE